MSDTKAAIPTTAHRVGMGKAVATAVIGVGIVVGMSMKEGMAIAVLKVADRERDPIGTVWTVGEAEEIVAIIAVMIRVAGIVLVIAMETAGTGMTNAVVITAGSILVVGIVRTVVVVMTLIEVGIVPTEVVKVHIDGRDRMGEVTPTDGIRQDGGMITGVGMNMIGVTPEDRRAMIEGMMVVQIAATIGEAIAGIREMVAGVTGVAIEATDGTAIGRAIGVPGINRSTN